jgi:F0F1-type ATP synthase membrane subunit b/b'
LLHYPQVEKKKEVKETKVLSYKQQKRSEDEALAKLRQDAAATATSVARMQADLDAHRGIAPLADLHPFSVPLPRTKF